MLGKIEGKGRRGRQRTRWLDSITDSKDMSWTNSGREWRIEEPGVLQSVGPQRAGHDWTTTEEWQQAGGRGSPGGPGTDQGSQSFGPLNGREADGTEVLQDPAEHPQQPLSGDLPMIMGSWEADFERWQTEATHFHGEQNCNRALLSALLSGTWYQRVLLFITVCKTISLNYSLCNISTLTLKSIFDNHKKQYVWWNTSFISAVTNFTFRQLLLFFVCFFVFPSYLD